MKATRKLVRNDEREPGKRPFMKPIFQFLGLTILGGGLLVAGCGKKQAVLWQSIKNPEITAQLKSFVAEKEAQANASTNEAPPGLAHFFAAAEKGDWLAVSNAFADFRKHAGQYEHSGKTDERLRGTRWQAIIEIWGAFDAFGEGDAKYSAAFGNDIIESIPPGSIYFGGTDAGRFVVTAMQKSQVNGDPFYRLTQNALADSTYLGYVRDMYGDKIYIPTAEDLQKCFDEYSADLQRRNEQHQLKPGENFRIVEGKPQISGQFAVTQIDGLLAKVIFDKNPGNEFYLEESFPFDWMYPCLEPHGLIFKINRQPLSGLSDEVVQRDHDYWTNCVQPMIGDWLEDDTPLKEVAAFAEKVFLREDFTGFAGDPRFIQNTYAHRMFSKERSSIAGLYAWRAQHAADAAEKERMNDAADFAFRQAWALCPYSPETVFRYVNLLISRQRISDALLVAETAAEFPSTTGTKDRQMQNLVDQLKRFQKRK